MPFREKQRFASYSFSPVMEQVEIRKKDKVTYKMEDATLRKLPSPSNFKLTNIIETDNVSKLQQVNTIISSRVNMPEEKQQTETTTINEEV